MQHSAGACIALALLYSIVSLEPMRNKALYSGEAERAVSLNGSWKLRLGRFLVIGDDSKQLIAE